MFCNGTFKTHKLKSAFVCLVCFVLHNTVLANEANLKNIDSATISICYEEWQPYAYTNEQGEITGNVIDELNSAAVVANTLISFDELPYSRCLESIKSGNHDFILFADDSDGIELLARPITYWQISAVSSIQLPIPSFENLTDTRIENIAICRDYEYPAQMMVKLKLLAKDVVKTSCYIASKQDVLALLNLIIRQSVDVMLLDKTWVELMSSQLGIQLSISDWLFHQEPQYVGYLSTSKVKVTLMTNVLEQVSQPKGLKEPH